MMLWLMVQPGVWDHYIDVYKDEAECNAAIEVFEKVVPHFKLNTKARQRAHQRKVYIEGASRPGIMWTSCY